MPKQINTPFVSQKLVPLFGMKGRFQPVVDEVVVPVISVDPQIETRLALGGAAAGAVAAEYPTSSIENPAASGVDILVESVLVGAGAILWYLTSSGYIWTLGVKTAGDTEFADVDQPGLPAGLVYGGSSTALTTFRGWRAYIAVGRDMPVNMVIHPGQALMIQSPTVNTTVYFGWRWREVDQNVNG